MPSDAQAEAAMLERLVDFAVAKGGRCFRGWDREAVRVYLRVNLAHGTCAWAQEFGKVTGLATGWPGNERDFRRAEFVQAPWRWMVPNWAGDSFYIDQLMATTPRAVVTFAGEFQHRWPEWRRWKLFAIRRGRLVQYRWPARFLRKLLKAERRLCESN